ncbi:flavodoxin [Stenotrophomonas aracearum]|jgi:flavodoxin|uniref:Flavodoxin n=1 Tax=Stenotrophomonas aracearum TaxID=3003272 RepID=A0ABY9YFW4_9GAMM|nr:flavodoxin [Stenotrophomonas sp. A5588]WNH49765.1 flavodoxin [Stenotrophomonas sp. A5588]
MAVPQDPSRRAVVAALASLPLGGAVPAGGEAPENRMNGSATLVAYFSRSGNTRVVAGLIQRAFGADLFEIQPAVPYPDEYLATVEQARQERDRGIEPALEATIATIRSYETVYLGFPIWGETAPPVIRSFLSRHDLSGKTLIPFVTHGGYGLGSSRAVVARMAPEANLQKEFLMQADQERQTMERVNQWLQRSR